MLRNQDTCRQLMVCWTPAESHMAEDENSHTKKSDMVFNKLMSLLQTRLWAAALGKERSSSSDPGSLVLTHSTVVSHKSGVSLLIGEVGGEQEAEGVSGGGDDLLSWHCLRVRLLLPTEQTQHLPLCLHLQTKHKNMSGSCSCGSE